MKRFTVIDTFVILVLILTIIKSTTGIKSSICPRCDEHYLSCPIGQQIDISSAYQGFTQSDNTCTDCKAECCTYYKNDCLEHYQGVEYSPLMRCCGKSKCTLKGSVGDLSYCEQYQNFMYKNVSSYSQITYRCVEEPTIKPSIDSGWKEMSSLQVVIDGMKPYYCTYSIVSLYYNFFQTNTKGTSFQISRNLKLKCNVHYSVLGYTTFTTQPFTDVFIVLSGYSRIHIYNSQQMISVKYRCNNDSNAGTTVGEIESTTMVSAQTTQRLILNEVTEGTDDLMEEETNNQTRQQYEDALLIGGDKNNNVLVGSLVGGIGGLCLLILVVFVIIFVIKKRRQRPIINEGGVSGCVNPGYGISDPDNLSTVGASGGITVKNDNSTVEYLRDEVRFDPLPVIQLPEYNNAYDNVRF